MSYSRELSLKASEEMFFTLPFCLNSSSLFALSYYESYLGSSIFGGGATSFELKFVFVLDY